MDLTKLAELLAKETYPHRYIHKFIGNKTKDFLSGVAQLEKSFPRARRVTEREAADGRGGHYLALTFELDADSPQEIVALFEETLKLPDLKIIL